MGDSSSGPVILSCVAIFHGILGNGEISTQGSVQTTATTPSGCNYSQQCKDVQCIMGRIHTTHKTL